MESRIIITLSILWSLGVLLVFIGYKLTPVVEKYYPKVIKNLDYLKPTFPTPKRILRHNLWSVPFNIMLIPPMIIFLGVIFLTAAFVFTITMLSL